MDEYTDLDEVYRHPVSGHSGAVVTRGSDLLGVVTRIDLVNFWDDTFSRPGI